MACYVICFVAHHAKSPLVDDTPTFTVLWLVYTLRTKSEMRLYLWLLYQIATVVSCLEFYSPLVICRTRGPTRRLTGSRIPSRKSLLRRSFSTSQITEEILLLDELFPKIMTICGLKLAFREHVGAQNAQGLFYNIIDR